MSQVLSETKSNAGSCEKRPAPLSNARSDVNLCFAAWGCQVQLPSPAGFVSGDDDDGGGDTLASKAVGKRKCCDRYVTILPVGREKRLRKLSVVVPENNVAEDDATCGKVVLSPELRDSYRADFARGSASDVEDEEGGGGEADVNAGPEGLSSKVPPAAGTAASSSVSKAQVSPCNKALTKFSLVQYKGVGAIVIDVASDGSTCSVLQFSGEYHPNVGVGDVCEGLSVYQFMGRDGKWCSFPEKTSLKIEWNLMKGNEMFAISFKDNMTNTNEPWDFIFRGSRQQMVRRSSVSRSQHQFGSSVDVWDHIVNGAQPPRSAEEETVVTGRGAAGPFRRIRIVHRDGTVKEDGNNAVSGRSKFWYAASPTEWGVCDDLTNAVFSFHSLNKTSGFSYCGLHRRGDTAFKPGPRYFVTRLADGSFIRLCEDTGLRQCVVPEESARNRQKPSVYDSVANPSSLLSRLSLPSNCCEVVRGSGAWSRIQSLCFPRKVKSIIGVNLPMPGSDAMSQPCDLSLMWLIEQRLMQKRRSGMKDSVITQWTWHATTKEAIESIVRNGFELRPVATGTVNGRGFYVAKQQHFVRSFRYAVPDACGDKFMLLCQTVVGACEVSAPKQTHSSDESMFDSGGNNASDIVIWSHHARRILPRFVVVL